jgi:hypothetical protein
MPLPRPVATREVFRAKRELDEVKGIIRRETGILQARREHAEARLRKALEEQRRLQDEYDRLKYTLEAAFGTTFGQQTLTLTAPASPRPTFIVRTSQTQLRARLKALRVKLAEAPD